jgi:predicted MFS family arabinose efflux permease
MLAGVVVVHVGYSASFLTLAGVAVVGLALYFFVMPETQARTEPEPNRSTIKFAVE